MEIGIDIVSIQKVKFLYETYGDAFLNRVLLPDEIKYCQSKRFPSASIAGRIAAKEAFVKALGTGISGRTPWHAVEIIHPHSGKPFLQTTTHLATDLRTYLANKQIAVSISHTSDFATAVTIIS